MKVERWEFSFRKGLERRCLYKDVDKKRKQTVNDTRRTFLGRGHGRHKPEKLHRLFKKVRGRSSDPARVGRDAGKGGWDTKRRGPGKTRMCQVLKAI